MQIKHGIFHFTGPLKPTGTGTTVPPAPPPSCEGPEKGQGGTLAMKHPVY